MGRSRFLDRVKDHAARAARDFVSSEKGGAAMAAAMRSVQEGRRLVDEKGARMVGALGLATQADVERLGRKIGRLRKRLQQLVDDV